MLFSSMTFVFMFLPIVCTLYLLVRKELKNFVLLAASILFYAWGEPRYVAIMLATIVINWLGGILISETKYKKTMLFLTVIGDLSFLFYFKYFNFFVENINALIGGHIDFIKVIMPIGISFYTFQAISYVVDVYREEVKAQKDIYKLALYISLFPQLVAGPIVKYHDVADQIENRTVDFDKVYYGVRRFIVGLAKKMLLANTMGAVADKIFTQPTEQLDVAISWLGAVCYTLQIYYDFSGYSDMAIGLGSIFGFKFLENFNYPYISKSITEFWRRWHISLSTWFKEYLYIPLGGNKKGSLRTYFNLFIVFLVTGFWHGATWSFIVWGMWNALFIIVERMSGIYKKTGNIAFSIFQHFYTISAFTIGWVIFRADTLTYAYKYILAMFGFNQNIVPVYKWGYYVDRLEIIAFIAGVICATPIFGHLLQEPQKYITIKKLCLNTWLLVIFIISTSYIAASTYNPFIYFRF